jgi:Na+-translocating ferredoxin:NAD+ oxidoreductase RnfA subunit
MGEYYLPVINPVSEGSLFDFIFVLFCVFIGYEKIQNQSSFGLTITEIYALVLVISQIYQNIEMIIEITSAKKYDRPFKWGKFLSDLSSYYLILSLCILISLVSHNDVIHDNYECGRCLMY